MVLDAGVLITNSELSFSFEAIKDSSWNSLTDKWFEQPSRKIIFYTYFWMSICPFIAFFN